MTANNVDQDAAERLRRVERQLGELLRRRSGEQPNLRDLRDTDLTKVRAGQTTAYNEGSGRWEPTLILPPFSLAGAVTVSASGRFYVPRSARVRRMFVALTTAGTTTTTVRLLRNGTSVASVSLASGAFTGGVDLNQTFTGPEADYMQADVSVAGTAAAGLTVVLR